MSPKRRTKRRHKARLNPQKRRAAKRGASKRAAAPKRKQRARAVRRKESRATKKSQAARAARATKKRGAARAAVKPARAVKKPAAPSKVQLRVKLRAMRARLTLEQRRFAAARVLANLVGTRAFGVSRRIACYLPADGEVDTRDVIERIQRMRKTVYLPVLSRLRADRLWFAALGSETKLAPNRFGILEPRVPARELLRAEELDLILLPLVAFDRDGNRLGRGAGYYDRSLAFLRNRRFLRKPRLLGLAYDFQRVAKIGADPWDVALDGVVTDRAVHVVES